MGEEYIELKLGKVYFADSKGRLHPIRGAQTLAFPKKERKFEEKFEKWFQEICMK